MVKMKSYKPGKLLLLTFVLFLSCSKNNTETLRQTFFRMDTIVTVTLTKESPVSPDSIWPSVDSILKNWEERFSITSEKSEVMKLNKRQSDTQAISRLLGEMISVAKRFSDTLNGDFDFTILPIKEIWGMAENSPDSLPAPTQKQIDSALLMVDYKQVQVNASHDTLFFSNPFVKIDVGGVAKGFALKSVAHFLETKGIQNYLVNGGGDIIGKGKKDNGTFWNIGIQHPRSNDSMLATFPLSQKSVFTSGDYERFRIVDGRRVHHLFNPKTGYSSTNNQSLTIYGPDPLENKFYSTGLFCRSVDSIMTFVNKRSHLQCMIVDSTGTVFVSERWKKEITL
jgi:thiamine biosynthesis lipoprotein